ncbi:SurA N-terminal domain-containing protein [Mameliella sediminis]|uniref:SurA N-terminal domain-containing protein n=1 Tax=Mameliella sediminis TaxID=2836866 RepID=UPI001C47C90A|nr:SurA N-terminal domain-containing protein [Mameliella sediminis]MBV7393602.1 SurA N-terminal domain-containing protein [Mameliella sediminis]MBY6160998.1 SurA N-terminal domain-containing protein [Mameliella alba]MBY6169468.1 SurA N-terminal domain-containing protein [Mameliella alba]MBY6174487.1 SurA N-terminal domain-containing protein [Mameliella alba]
MFVLTRLLAPAIAALGIALAPLPVSAQNLFAPAIQVNDSVITYYELQQRKRMLQVLQAPGDSTKLAREQLIDDRLRLQAARDNGIRPTDEEILDGMAEFAGRANMSRDQFVAALAAEGVAEQTFRDFVHAGLSWRQLVQARFGGRASVSEDEIDRALSRQGTGSNVQVLLSELIMPVPPGQEELVSTRAERISQLKSFGAFSAEARQYSATATRDAGGRLPWQNLADLPPPLQPLLLGLAPGEVTAPIPLEGAIALFQMRDIRETGFAPAKVAAVEYAAYYMPGGRSAETLARARQIAGQVDRCDDLYGIAKGQPEEVLERGTLPVEELPTDIALELSKLDPGEVSTALTRSGGQTLVFLMLCGRSADLSEEVDRSQITIGLRNQRLGKLADGYLAQLRADALLVEK